MASLLALIGLGGIVGAAGAITAGLILLAIRILVNPRERERQLARIREVGLLAAAKEALFDGREAELQLRQRNERAATH